MSDWPPSHGPMGSDDTIDDDMETHVMRQSAMIDCHRLDWLERMRPTITLGNGFVLEDIGNDGHMSVRRAIDFCMTAENHAQPPSGKAPLDSQSETEETA